MSLIKLRYDIRCEHFTLQKGEATNRLTLSNAGQKNNYIDFRKYQYSRRFSNSSTIVMKLSYLVPTAIE
jgi:hypothetical protein